jgi:actin-like ATPase involved in cell morphogenesis
VGGVVTTADLTLAIDFGTTNTVAVARRNGAAPRVVSVDGAPYQPSAVLLGADGALVVGTDALRLGRAAAHRLETRPKARLAEDVLLLGDTQVDVQTVVRAVLAKVTSAAARQAGGPVDHLVLTHPADWGAVRMGKLLSAAAGLAPRVSLVPEPVAVAVRAGLPAGAAVLVVDLGGGTCDAAVVRRDETGFTVLACAGLPDLGGDDLDQRIIDHLRPSAPDHTAIRAESLLRQDARAAKELLSRHESAQLTVPGAGAVTLSRDEFDALVDVDLNRVVALAERVVESAGVSPAGLQGVHLVGGTSRIPRVATLLRSALALPVHRDPEPESGVAWGAVELVADNESGAPTRPAPSAIPPSVHSGPSGVRRGPLAVCAAVAAVAVMTATVLLAREPAVDGKPVAAPRAAPSSTAEDAEPTFPPVRPGDPVVGAGEPRPVVVAPGGTGIFRATGTYEGATETRVAVRLDRGAVADRAAPTGYRWVVARVVATLLADGELPGGDGHNVYLRDDLGQLVESVNRAGDVTKALCGSDQQDLPATPSGEERTECAVFLVPVATGVRGVVYVDRHADALGAHALQFPVDLPATGKAALPSGDGRVGGPPVEVSTGTEFAEITVADVIDTPSAYLADPKPPPGTALHVVRIAIRASGVGKVRTYGLADGIQVLDDRGLLIPVDGFIGYKRRECPDPPEELAPGATAQTCLVFSLSRHATIGRIVFGSWDASDDPTRWTVWEPPT